MVLRDVTLKVGEKDACMVLRTDNGGAGCDDGNVGADNLSQYLGVGR